MLGATLFGSMFLLPLYYQIARGQEAWVAGFLMAPQGIGAACIMRWAGSMTDRFGPRRIVPFGILLMAAATVPFAFVTTSTSEVLLAGTLFVRGLGLGLTMMPVTAAAYFDLNHAEIPKASTTMNIVRQVGGSVATALFAVVLERQIVAELGPAAAKAGGSAGVISSTVKLPPAGGRPRGGGVRPHLLVVRRRHPARLHPDPVPAQPRRRRRPGSRREPSAGRRGPPARTRATRRRGDARLTARPDPCWPSVTARLARAGCVAAAEEATELVALRRRRPSCCEGLAERRVDGEPLAWVTGRAAFGDLTVRVDPGVYVPRWQSLELARRAGVRLPDDGTAIDLCTGSGAVAVALRRRGRRPGSSQPTATPGLSPAPGPTGSRPSRATCSLPCRPRSGADRRRRGGRALRPLRRAPPPPPRHARGSRLPPTTTAGRDGVDVLRAGRHRAPGFLRRGGALLLELGGEQSDLLRVTLERLGLRGVRTWSDEDGDLRGLEATLG